MTCSASAAAIELALEGPVKPFCALVLGTSLMLMGCGGSSDNGAASNPDDAGAASLPDLALVRCDLSTQDCAAGQKCTPDLDSDTPGAGLCVRAGAVAEGQPCTYGDDDYDNCAPGSWCDFDTPDAAETCHRLCSSDAGCVTGQLCADMYASGFGYCVSPCTPFGKDCPDGSSCAGVWPTFGSANASDVIFLCKDTGSAPAFAHCGIDEDCGENLFCDIDRLRCVPVCDDKHACAPIEASDGGAALSCHPISRLPNGQGTCG
jgi:hypothetical protein